MKIITDDGQGYAIETMKTADLSPEDVIVFRSEITLSDDDTQRLGNTLRSIWPENQTLILSGGLSVEIHHQKAKPLLWCPECNETMEATYTHEYHMCKNEDGFFEQHQLLTKEPV